MSPVRGKTNINCVQFYVGIHNNITESGKNRKRMSRAKSTNNQIHLHIRLIQNVVKQFFKNLFKVHCKIKKKM